MTEKITLQTPRQIRTQQVKQAILQTTTALIKEYGIEYVTVSNICKAAEVSTGSFYHHFGSKDELLAYYLVDAFDKRAEEFRAIQGGDVVANVLRCFTLYNNFLLEQGFDFIRNYYTTTNKGLYSRRSYQNGRESYVSLTKTIERLFEQGNADGYLVDGCDVDALIYDLSIVEKGVIFDWCLCDGDYDMVKEANRLLYNYMLTSMVSQKYRQDYPQPRPGAL